MINFLNLEYFLGGCGGIKLHPRCKRFIFHSKSLSNHISNLEKEFDVVLFNRTSH